MFKKGMIVSEETRKKISVANKGRRKGNKTRQINDTVEIKLNYGHKAIIDLKDLPLVAGYTWRWCRGYVVTTIYPDGKVNILSLHRHIAGIPPKGLFTDHINGNKLDNRRSNLRFVTASQNKMNRVITNRNGVNGVYERNEGTFVAKLFMNGEYKLNRTFDTKEEAIKARQEAEKEFYGEYRRVK